MTRLPLTDVQITTGLRAHLPSQAAAGLRERITTQVASIPQVRRLPWFLGVNDADPDARRRALLLVAAAALLAAAFAVALVGAWLESQKRDVDLTRGPEVDSFVFAAYERVTTELPAFRLVLHDSLEGTLDTVYAYNGDGVLREEYDGDAKLFGDDFTADLKQLDNDSIWVVSNDPAEPALVRLLQTLWGGPTNCPTGWQSIETVEILGRSARHVRCTVVDPKLGTLETHLWIDMQTGLPLRSGHPTVEMDQPGATTFVALEYRDVVQLDIGPQPASLFDLGDTSMTWPEYDCATTGVCPSMGPSETDPAGSAPPAEPVETPLPAPGPATAPADLDAFVAAARAAYADAGALELVIVPARGPDIGLPQFVRWQQDGLGSSRAELDDPTDGSPPVIWLVTGGRFYETDPKDGKQWRDWGPTTGVVGPPTFGLPTGCGIGWRYLGDDLVLGRPAAHVMCGPREFWIDRAWLFVTRAHDHDPLLGGDPAAGLSQVISITFAPQPEALFAAPDPDDVWRGM